MGTDGVCGIPRGWGREGRGGERREIEGSGLRRSGRGSCRSGSGGAPKGDGRGQGRKEGGYWFFASANRVIRSRPAGQCGWCGGNFPCAHMPCCTIVTPASDMFWVPTCCATTGLFDEFLSYPVAGGDVLKPWRMAALLARIRRRHYDTVVYLAPSKRSPGQLARDRRFFSLAGVRAFIGMEGFDASAVRGGRHLHEARAESAVVGDRLGAQDFRSRGGTGPGWVLVWAERKSRR